MLEKLLSAEVKTPVAPSSCRPAPEEWSSVAFFRVSGPVIAVCLLFFSQPIVVQADENENHCFTCHTNPRKLIEITREISKLATNKPGASKETKGEG